MEARQAAHVGSDVTGTDIYRGAIEHDYGDQRCTDLMRQVWDPTPWITNAYTGSFSEEPTRRLEIREWLTERFGAEAWPLHGRPGRWHTGSVTVNGWTWIGFDTEEAMREFEEAWPAPARSGA